MDTESASPVAPARSTSSVTKRSDDKLAVGVSAGIVLAAVVVWVGAMFGGVQVSRWWSPQPEVVAHPKLAGQPARPILDTQTAAAGHAVFARTCATCHGASGEGKAGLGKDLVRSNFVLGLDDGKLAAFIAAGRDAADPANTTKMPMPPKGGNATLTDQDLASVVIYMRGLQDPRRMPELPPLPPAPVAAAPTQEEKAAALAAAGGDADLAAFIAGGAKVFAATCAACHGPTGKGLKGLGKDLVANEFVTKNDDDKLLAFIKRGRTPGEPDNTTGVAMPPKGGNPALSDDDILDVIAYLRSLQSAKPRADGGSPTPAPSAPR